MNTRLHSLDALRGIAALAVVLYHWRHLVGNRTVENLPLHGALRLAYDHGSYAVDLFFTISGFIFFTLYSDRVSSRATSFSRFLLLRLSRLYPLHFLTMIAAAAMQLHFRTMTNAYFVYPANDVGTMLANIGFYHAWAQSPRWGFNGPSWSVSIECLCYLAFFAAVLASGRFRTIIALGIVVAVPFLHFPVVVTSGLSGFFIGGVVAWCYQASLGIWLSPVLGLALIGWGAVAIGVRVDPRWLTYALFPLTVFALAISDGAKFNPLRRFGWLGDISYGVYLWHFPLQLAAVIGVLRFGVRPDVMITPLFVSAFLMALIAISWVSHRFFEMPVQNWLRGRV